MLFIICINEQPVHPNTRSFLYADDLCITSLEQSFEKVEHCLTEALDGLTNYYVVSHLRANPEKTQISAFHLNNRDGNRQLNASWNGRKLTYNPKLLYTIKAKVGARTNILRKLSKQIQKGNTPGYQQLNMPVLYRAALHMPRRWIESPTWPVELL